MPTYPATVIRPLRGGIYEAGDGSLYGYSPEVSLGATAGVSQEMFRFNLQKESKFQIMFFQDYDQIDASGIPYGFVINIDNQDTCRLVYDAGGTSSTGPPITPINFYVPANAEVVISLLNPSAGASLSRSSCVLLGEYLEVSEAYQSAGVEVGFKAQAPLIAARSRNKRWGNLLG